MDDLTGWNAVVTGGASGIGFGMARAFLRRGARVALVDISADALAEAEASLGDDADRVVHRSSGRRRPRRRRARARGV